MFWMQSNGESDENILYPLTTKWQRLRLELTSVFFLHDVIRDHSDHPPRVSHYAYSYIGNSID